MFTKLSLYKRNETECMSQCLLKVGCFLNIALLSVVLSVTDEINGDRLRAIWKNGHIIKKMN